MFLIVSLLCHGLSQAHLRLRVRVLTLGLLDDQAYPRNIHVWVLLSFQQPTFQEITKHHLCSAAHVLVFILFQVNFGDVGC